MKKLFFFTFSIFMFVSNANAQDICDGFSGAEYSKCMYCMQRHGTPFCSGIECPFGGIPGDPWCPTNGGTSCPYGGFYPNCSCPPNQMGTYPNCQDMPGTSCEYGGTFPNCTPKPEEPNCECAGQRPTSKYHNAFKDPEVRKFVSSKISGHLTETLFGKFLEKFAPGSSVLMTEILKSQHGNIAEVLTESLMDRAAASVGGSLTQGVFEFSLESLAAVLVEKGFTSEPIPVGMAIAAYITVEQMQPYTYTPVFSCTFRGLSIIQGCSPSCFPKGSEVCPDFGSLGNTRDFDVVKWILSLPMGSSFKIMTMALAPQTAFASQEVGGFPDARVTINFVYQDQVSYSDPDPGSSATNTGNAGNPGTNIHDEHVALVNTWYREELCRPNGSAGDPGAEGWVNWLDQGANPEEVRAAISAYRNEPGNCG